LEAEGLARRIAQPTIRAREILRLHHETYPVFWEWSQAQLDRAMLYCSLQTVFGWPIRVVAGANPRSLRNFPMQGNGSEMLRLACCLATERGIEVCCPVHDALLILAPLDQLEADIATAREAMREASRLVLKNFELTTGTTTVEYPNRYADKRGAEMWNKVMAILARSTAEAA
jgi:hypothetical protein